MLICPQPPKWSIEINDTSPVFFYCSAPGSCITYGMVGVINPNATTSLAYQRQLAQDSAFQLNPGEPFPAESPLPSNLPSSTSIPTAHVRPPRSGKLSAGAIAGIAIACVGVVVLAALLFWFWGRFKGLNEEMQRKDSTIRHTSPRSPTFFGSAHPHPSHSLPAYSQTPLSQNPGIPPAYFGTPSATPTPGYASPCPAPNHHHAPPSDFSSHSSNNNSNRVSRAASHRSVGGTFDISPTTGYYTRTHEGQDSYKYTAPHTSDMTSPVDPNLIPVGPYGRQMMDLQRLNRYVFSSFSVPLHSLFLFFLLQCLDRMHRMR